MDEIDVSEVVVPLLPPGLPSEAAGNGRVQIVALAEQVAVELASVRGGSEISLARTGVIPAGCKSTPTSACCTVDEAGRERGVTTHGGGCARQPPPPVC